VFLESRNVPFFIALILLAMAISAASRIEAADLFLNDEPEVYAAIDRLSALGYLPRLPANTRPYSVRALRAAMKPDPRTAAPRGFDEELFRWLAAYVAPKEMGRLTGAAAFSDSRFTPANGEGVPVPKGWSGSASIAIREQTTPLVNGQLRFTSFYGEGGDDGNRLLDASIELGPSWLAVQAGKISTWYGPGRHGALIFTNNAAPYPGIRIHNPEPILPPGPFSFLGALQYDVFAVRMEKKELFSHSLLVGTRLAARPSRWFEVGLSRAMHFDGKGRSSGIGEFLTDFFGNDDLPDNSNSLYGFDLTLTLPLAVLPVQAYWERAGESRSHVGTIFLPWSDRWANLYGLYFPGSSDSPASTCASSTRTTKAAGPGTTTGTRTPPTRTGTLGRSSGTRWEETRRTCSSSRATISGRTCTPGSPTNGSCATARTQRASAARSSPRGSSPGSRKTGGGRRAPPGTT
jgi:hypothetical protein